MFLVINKKGQGIHFPTPDTCKNKPLQSGFISNKAFVGRGFAPLTKTVIMYKLSHSISSVKKLSAAIKKIPKGICPFKETPSAERTQDNDNQLTGAQELFSLFTADIIKAKTVFVR